MGKRKFKGHAGEPLYKAYRITSPAHETKIVFAAGVWSAVGVRRSCLSVKTPPEVGTGVVHDLAANLMHGAQRMNNPCKPDSVAASVNASSGTTKCTQRFPPTSAVRSFA